MATVEVLDETSRFPDSEALEVALTRLLDARGLHRREVTVVLVDDDSIAERNLRDRGVEGPTDVLSYPSAEPTDVGFPDVPHLGDVFVSLDSAARQAPAGDPTPSLEVAALAAHGVTHLMGFDHHERHEWAPFEAAQAEARAAMAALLGVHDAAAQVADATVAGAERGRA